MYPFIGPNERARGEHAPLSIQTVFDGYNLDETLTDENGRFMTLTVSGRNDLTYRRTLYEVDGMEGALEENEGYQDSREITVKFRVTDRTNRGFRDRLDRLNALLDGTKRELEFTDDSVLFYASALQVEIPEEESNDLVGTITFLCSDPFKYGGQKRATFGSDHVTFEVNGSVPTAPIFEIRAIEPTTFVLIQNQDNEYMMLGQPAPIDTTPFDFQTLILHDPCNSLNGWTIAGEVDNGYVTGEMASHSYGYFYPERVDVPVVPHRWQGPSIKRSLGEQLENFRMDVEVELLNVGKGTGMLEIYLLDDANNTVMKIGIEDIWRGIDRVQGKFQLGETGNRENHYIQASYPPAWNDFKGVLKLYRSGRRIRPYFALRDERGKDVWVYSSHVYVDHANEYQTPVSQIQIAARTHPPTNQMADIRVHDIKVWRYNQAVGIPYILNPNDVLTLNHQTNEILVNGMSRKDLITFGSDFFDLKRGRNEIIVYPPNSLDVSMIYRERYR